jgi:hypothetical protein
MIDIQSRFKSVTDREKWAARGASFVAKTKATKAVWFPPEPVETGKKAARKTAAAASRGTKQATRKSTGAAKKSTGAARRTTGAAKRAGGAKKSAAKKSTGTAKKTS